MRTILNNSTMTRRRSSNSGCKRQPEECKRLEEDLNDHDKTWRRWGPYLSERQWGTVREDYSHDGSRWKNFSISFYHFSLFQTNCVRILCVLKRYTTIACSKPSSKNDIKEFFLLLIRHENRRSKTWNFALLATRVIQFLFRNPWLQNTIYKLLAIKREGQNSINM